MSIEALKLIFSPYDKIEGNDPAAKNKAAVENILRFTGRHVCVCFSAIPGLTCLILSVLRKTPVLPPQWMLINKTFVRVIGASFLSGLVSFGFFFAKVIQSNSNIALVPEVIRQTARFTKYTTGIGVLGFALAVIHNGYPTAIRSSYLLPTAAFMLTNALYLKFFRWEASFFKDSKTQETKK